MRTGALRLIWSNPRQCVCMFFLLVCAWALGLRLVHQAPHLHSRMQDVLDAVYPATQMGGLVHSQVHTPKCILLCKWGACHLGTHQRHTKGILLCQWGSWYTKRTPSVSCYANGGLDTLKRTPSAHQVNTKYILLYKWGACVSAHQVHPVMQMGGLAHERTPSAHQMHPVLQMGGLLDTLKRTPSARTK